MGLWRDKDLIPNDTDIDVIILTDKDSGLDIPALEGFHPLQSFDNGVPVQRAFVDDENGCIFDIYFYYRDLDPTGQNAISPYSHDLAIPLHLYENRQEIETQYGKLFFPSPIEDYLLANYGSDWRTPKEDKGIFA